MTINVDHRDICISSSRQQELQRAVGQCVRATGYPIVQKVLRVCRRLIGYVNTSIGFIGEKEEKKGK